MARPVKYTKEKINEIELKLNEYIESTDIPIVAEFAYMYGIRRSTLYDIKELSYTMGKLRDKKEAQLEKLGLYSKINASLAAFSLKQLGWRDKQDIEHSGGIQFVRIDKDDESL